MNPISPQLFRFAVKPTVFFLALLPAVLLVVRLFTNELGVNPVETLTHETGIWSLRLLLASLALTPLRLLFGVRQPLLLRRMLGLFAFFYLTAHFLIYVYLDHQLRWQTIWDDVVERKFITVGFIALVLMIPLAATSFRLAQRALGRRWMQLHRLVYICAALGLLHFVWLVKADLSEPLLYVGIFTLLMGARLYHWLAPYFSLKPD